MLKREANTGGRLGDGFAVVCAVGALIVSGYLTVVSLRGGVSPAGCGAGSGCAEVLSSKWSRVWGVPVSLLAVVAYLDVLFAMAVRARGSAWMRRVGRLGLMFWSGVIVGSAAWFGYLQVFVLGAVCPYCVAGHGLGVALVVTLWARGRLRGLGAGAVGLAAVVVMAALQINSTGALTVIEGDSEAVGADAREDGRRMVTFLNDGLELTLDAEPVLGDADAEHVVAMMFDYGCLHCRHTHGVLAEARAAYPGRLAVVALPVPMNPSCNEHVADDLGPRFAESCELARIGLAVFVAEPGSYGGFDAWMYEPKAARTAAEARLEAAKRVGAAAFEQAYDDPRTEAMLARNVAAYGLSEAGRVPVLVMPAGHASAAVVGRVDEVSQVVELLGLEAGGAER